MARFLSTEWVAALSEALQAAEVTTGNGPPLVVQHLVDHADGTRSAYRIVLDAHGAEAQVGHVSEATVTYRQNYEVARGIATGERDAHVEFLRGRLVLSGDTKALLAYRRTLEQVHLALRDLRHSTDFPAAAVAGG